MAQYQASEKDAHIIAQEREQLDAVFKDTRQALHVSFAVLSQEPRGESVITKGLIRLLESLPELTHRQEAWLNQLRGERTGTVNFSGLTSDEIRAQCADVISAVRTKLHHAEQWAVMARFGQMVTGEDPKTKAVRIVFPPDRARALKQLAAWIQPSCSSLSIPVLECLIVKVFANHDRMRASFRDMASEFGGNHMVYARQYPIIKARMVELEDLAVARLRPYFERTGLVEREIEDFDVYVDV